MSFIHPALICFAIVGMTSLINANIKSLKLVARRFSAFKAKLGHDGKQTKYKLYANTELKIIPNIPLKSSTNLALADLILHDDMMTAHQHNKKIFSQANSLRLNPIRKNQLLVFRIWVFVLTNLSLGDLLCLRCRL